MEFSVTGQGRWWHSRMSKGVSLSPEGWLEEAETGTLCVAQLQEPYRNWVSQFGNSF